MIMYQTYYYYAKYCEGISTKHLKVIITENKIIPSFVPPQPERKYSIQIEKHVHDT